MSANPAATPAEASVDFPVPMFPVALTPAAVERIVGICAEERSPFLRVYVQGGGCSGFSYAFTLEEEPQEDDMRWAQPGFELLVDPFSAPLLEGATVDWQENLYGSQFVVQNPKATATCGCGSSFSV